MMYKHTIKAGLRVWLHCIMFPFRPVKNMKEGSRYIADALDKDAEEELQRRDCEINDIK